MTPFLLPWPLYVALGFMTFASLYNFASWNVLFYYMQSNYPEQVPRVRTLIVVNRVLMTSTMIFSALSVGVSGSILEGVMTALIATPITLFSALFYVIFAALHKQMRVNVRID